MSVALQRTLRRLPVGLFLLFALIATAALANDDPAGSPSADGTAQYSPEVRQKAATIARQVMSPFCPGRTVADCTSEYAAEWRREIAKLLAEGKSPAEIQREFETRAGRDLSGSPNRGVGYVFPVVVALSAGFLLFVLFSRLKRKAPRTPPKETPTPSDVDEARLQEELRALDEDP